MSRRHPRLRRIVWMLVAVDLCVLAAMVVMYVAGVRPWQRPELRGSRPPAGQHLPGEAKLVGLSPSFPARQSMMGRPVVLVATCVSCRSGDVIGGFLARLGDRPFGGRARLEVIVWGGSASGWRRSAQVPRAWHVHGAGSYRDAASIRSALRVGESGQMLMYDRTLTWRSTWHLGQLDPAGVRHDVGVLERE